MAQGAHHPQNIGDQRLGQPPLPGGFRFVFFRPGDRDAWIGIERSAGELTSYAQGTEVWERYYGGREDALCRRMVFVENAAGEKVATARVGIFPRVWPRARITPRT